MSPAVSEIPIYVSRNKLSLHQTRIDNISRLFQEIVAFEIHTVVFTNDLYLPPPFIKAISANTHPKIYI